MGPWGDTGYDVLSHVGNYDIKPLWPQVILWKHRVDDKWLSIKKLLAIATCKSQSILILEHVAVGLLWKGF